MWQRKDSKAGSYVFPNLGRPCFVVVHERDRSGVVGKIVQIPARGPLIFRSKATLSALDQSGASPEIPRSKTGALRIHGRPAFPHRAILVCFLAHYCSVPPYVRSTPYHRPTPSGNVALFLDQEKRSPYLADNELSLLQKRTFRRRRAQTLSLGGTTPTLDPWLLTVGVHTPSPA